MASRTQEAGVERVIFINAGRFDDAEIYLRDPVSLIGPNNVGKTSAIGALQFLYVADFSRMVFKGKTALDTRRFYFRSDSSYILFECRAASGGLVTVGYRGLGPYQGHDVEIFAFPGGYVRSEFITDDDTSIDPSETRASITARTGSYFILQPKELSQMVAGGPDERLRSVHLGLVPLTRRADGDASRNHFRRLFQNLLNLNAINREEMKDTLVQVYLGNAKTAIDLASSSGEDYRRVERQQRTIASITAILPKADELRDASQRCTRSGTQIRALWRELSVARVREEAKFKGEIDQFDDHLRSLMQESRDLSTTQGEENQRIGALSFQQQQIANQITEIKAAAAAFPGFVESFAREALARMSDEVEALGESIGAATAESLVSLRQRLAVVDGEIAALERQIEGLDGLLSTRLTEEIGAAATTRLTAILSPTTLLLSKDDYTITDSAALRQLATTVAAGFDESGSGPDPLTAPYAASGIQIRRGALQWSNLPNAADLTAGLNARQTERAVLAGRIDSAERVEAQRTKKRELEVQLTAASAQLQRWESAQAALGSIKDLEKKARLAAGEQTELQSSVTQRGLRLQTITADTITARADQTKLQNTLTRLNNEVNALDQPPDDSPDDNGETRPGMSVYQLMTSYRACHTDYRDSRNRIVALVGDIGQHIDLGRLQTPEAKAAQVFETIQSLDQQRMAFETEQTALLETVRNPIKNLLQAYQQLERDLSDFNQRLGRVSISNLKRVSIRLARSPVHAEYERLVDSDGLLGQGVDYRRTLETLGGFINGTRGKIDVRQLFDLEFQIEGADGQVKHLKSVDADESHGTMLMVKALIYMILIRRMMQPNKTFQLPFYLDEALVLDPVNAAALTSTAVEQGFVPIFASTGPVFAATRFYSLRDAGGCAVIHQHEQLEKLSA